MGNPKPRQDAEHAAGRRAINAGFTDFYVRTYWTGVENICESTARDSQTHCVLRDHAGKMIREEYRSIVGEKMPDMERPRGIGP